ncbi:MAG TPA: tetratricopeptide repeat protein [Candidatus Deferrimicrobium sp.]|nr:tetratricopeptide repeat protein [Candidatus Deferrimicrobium sp.]
MALVAVRHTRKRHYDKASIDHPSESRRSTSAAVWLTIVCFGLAFMLLPAGTHFLGDGYQLLARLAAGTPSAKVWDIGASWLHDVIYSILPGEAGSRALLTYRVTSVSAGLIMLVGTALLSHRLFRSRFLAYLFSLGLWSGGYMLLFFGYVENYSPFIASVVLYVLVGLLACERKISRLWLFVPFALAAFLHLFGLLLLPSLLYLLLRTSRPGRALGRLPLKSKLLLATVLALISAVSYHFIYNASYFLTFALLPLTPDRFTIENDTLFSFKHILDICNLLMLLLPGLPVLVIALLLRPVRSYRHQPPYTFLFILILSTLAAVYVLNPGIGMPRNWDLFSIAGVPLAIFCFYVLLNVSRGARPLMFGALLAIALNFLVLGPRVASQVVPELGVAHFKNYLTLDKIRNRNARRLLVDYYRQIGDTAAARTEQARTQADFPESVHNRRARELMAQSQYREAAEHLHKAMELDPVSSDAYANLGSCLLNESKLDSALVLLQIADGLNPYNASTLNNLGTVYLRKGDLRRAERFFLRSLAIDSTGENALAGLASAYLRLGHYDRSLHYVSVLYERANVSSDYFRQAGDAYVGVQAFDQAAQAYEYAVRRGLDPAYVRNQEIKFPQLRR